MKPIKRVGQIKNKKKRIAAHRNAMPIGSMTLSELAERAAAGMLCNALQLRCNGCGCRFVMLTHVGAQQWACPYCRAVVLGNEASAKGA